jgi:flavorubredoxin
MNARPLTEGVWWVGAVDWDRRLFDSLIPLPEGTSYNAYLVRGAEKTALIDTVDPSMAEVLLSRLEGAGAGRIDYIVSNHSEQDHSGTIPRLLEMHPGARVVATEKAKGFLADLLEIPGDRVLTVKDGETISLGGLTLEFLHVPWVHWPETMLTWVPERRILFPCDLFGSHLATGDLFADDPVEILPPAKRYYAEILMPFRAAFEKNLARVVALDPAMIAPSHGPVYRNPKIILDAYRDWVSGPPKNLAVAAYVSMHDSTKRMVKHFVDACAGRGVRAEQINLADADVGRLAMLLVDAATIVIGTPVVNNGVHPQAAYAAFLANLLKPKARYLAVVGSMGWGGKPAEQLAALIPNLKVEILPPVIARGRPKAADFEAIDRLAEEVARRHQGL